MKHNLYRWAAWKALTVLALATILVAGATAVALAQSPDNTFTNFTGHMDDCNGRAEQSILPEPGNGCQTYNGDYYENVEYHPSSSNPGQCADIDSFHWGTDAEFLYFEWTLVGPYISGCESVIVGLELDVDADTESPQRGDYYLWTTMDMREPAAGGCGTYPNWIALPLSWDGFRDANNNVGDGNPGTGTGCDATCPDDPGDADGYETGHKVDNTIWCRTNPSSVYESDTVDPEFSPQPGFQLAVDRSWITSPALSNLRTRAWTSQSSSLSNDKLYWHDENPTDKLDDQDTDIDNTLWYTGPTNVTLASFTAAPNVNNLAAIALFVVGFLGVGIALTLFLHSSRR